jgi:cyclophilin family peptidyl-prolyl cis-trans isomerase/HEAT repeat protein
MAVAQVAPSDREEALPLLRELAASRDTGMAANASLGLGLTHDTISVSPLALNLARGGSLAQSAAWALGEIGAPARAVVSAALDRRSEQPANPGVVVMLLLAAARMPNMDLELLASYVREKNRSVQWAASYAIARQRTAEGVRILINAPANDPLVRAEIARGLTAQSAGDGVRRQALQVLTDFLQNDDYPSVRINAIRSLATYGSDARAAVIQATTDGDPNVRIAAAQAMGQVLGYNDTVWDSLWKADTSFMYRRSLLGSSVALGMPLPVIRQWRARSEWRYRAAAVEARGESPDPIEARTAALLATYDPDGRVRASAYSVLAATDTMRADTVVQRILDEAMDDPDLFAREAIPWYRRIPTTADSINANRPLTWYEDIVRTIVVPSLSEPTLAATITTDRGTMRLALLGVQAPLTVYNFMALAKQGFYNNVRFHRVVPNFVAQDGDPRGDGNGGPGYAIRDELNREPYFRGTVGMALSGPDTGGSQYFITLSPQPHLHGHYTVFARVVSGMAVMDNLVQGDLITSVTIP